jgi:hypothetical protein
LVEDDPIACHSERSEESRHFFALIELSNAGILRFAQNDRGWHFPLRMTNNPYEMADTSGSATALSPWWRHSAILVMIGGFSVLSFVTVLTYTNAPPIPEKAVDGAGDVVFTGADNCCAPRCRWQHGNLWAAVTLRGRCPQSK